jgi:Trk K+ transport system NAD-binding subunit
MTTMPTPQPNNLQNNRLAARRRIRAALRDTWLLFGQFKWPLATFAVTVFGGGVFYYQVASGTADQIATMAEGVYHVLGLVFLQPIEPFPVVWYLQIFYFVMPIIGIGILAQGVADFGVLFFNRKARNKEWEMAVASTYQQHVVLVGLGHLGVRVIQNLIKMGQDVVAVDLNTEPGLIARVQSLGVPVILEDAAAQTTLEAAGIRRARSIILCIQNDSLNLQIALKARSLNPAIEVILRIFDEDFATSLEQQFGFRAMSATTMVAPIFAGAAAGIEMTRPISVEGQAMSLARLRIAAGSRLARLRVADLEDTYNVSVVLLRRDGQVELHPNSEQLLAAEDTLAILGGPAEIALLSRDNRV